MRDWYKNILDQPKRHTSAKEYHEIQVKDVPILNLLREINADSTIYRRKLSIAASRIMVFNYSRKTWMLTSALRSRKRVSPATIT